MTSVFINEVHYENIGIDQWEGVEIAAPAGTNLDGWTIHVYDGSSKENKVVKLKGVIPNLKNGYGALFFKFSLKNSSHGTGLALVNSKGQVVQFLSYGASFVAKVGVASGKKAELIPVSETGWTQVGLSLQLQGTGSVYEDFKWVGPYKSSYGSINEGQTFVAPAKLKSLDLHLEANRSKHHTDKFHTKDMLILRRGEYFVIGLPGSSVDISRLSLRFRVYPEGSVKELKVAEQEQPTKDFYAFVSAESADGVNITIKIPGNAVVGEYLFSVSIDGGRTWHEDAPITVLFNAWSKEDPVYMSSEEQRNEYVLSDEGFIWIGNQYSYSPKAWNFAQFNTKSLQAALKLLQYLKVQSRGDPVVVSRHMSALVNAQHDGGVLVGNWSSDYSGGNSPTSWTGSAEILKEYLLTGDSVRYGQCWVFSGVLTTVMRSLGVPCRSVTNFASAHDVPLPRYNRSVDRYFKKGGLELDEEKTRDSVWNFHVWNDVWMERADLGPMYFGWQVIDATPQELSGGTYQTGPAPLVAVKDGTKDVPFDLEFIYSEVNADESYYVENDNGKGYTLIRTVTSSIGKSISTKAVGQRQRQDITSEYKYVEGSLEERVSHGAVDNNSGDVHFHWEVDDDTPIGSPITARLIVETSVASRSAQVNIVASVSQYTGKSRKTLKEERYDVPLVAGTPTPLVFTLDPGVYEQNLQVGDSFVFKAFVKVPETSQTSLLLREFNFNNFGLKFSVPAQSPTVGSTLRVKVEFSNTLSIPLTETKLIVEGQGLTKVQKFKFGTVQPGQTISHDVVLNILEKGEHLLIAQLDSAEVHGVHAHTEINVV